MPKLDFCQLDARGTGIDDVYEPIEIESSINKDGSINSNGKPANMHNLNVMTHANAEYLNSLLDLQKRIKEEYEHQLILNEKIEGEPEDLDSMVFWKKSKELLKPGADNLYYT